jgi:hypothetical protein
MFFKDFVSVKRQKIKRGASQTYDTPSKKKGAHFEHLNYHLLSILIVVYHDLLPVRYLGDDISIVGTIAYVFIIRSF